MKTNNIRDILEWIYEEPYLRTVDKAEIAITEYILEIIGEDEPENSIFDGVEHNIGEIVEPPVRNALRAEQRAKLKKGATHDNK